MRLTEDFSYIDPHRKAWLSPKGSIVDGASIPQAFWSFIGGPFEGQYRNASIVHDTACDRMTEPWDEVHLMFYEACRCGGVPDNKAKILYAAVYHFGPRWAYKVVAKQRKFSVKDGKEIVIPVEESVPEKIKRAEEPDKSVRDKLETFIDKENPSLQEIRELDVQKL